MPQEFDIKLEVSKWQQSVSTQDSQFPSGYPARCGKQRVAKIYIASE